MEECRTRRASERNKKSTTFLPIDKRRHSKHFGSGASVSGMTESWRLARNEEASRM